MKIRPRPNHAKRRRNKSRTSRRRARGVWNRNMLLLTKLAHKCTNRQPPTELTITLRLINILGLALIVMVLGYLGSDGNIKEIVDLGKELFRLLP
jgi:hypothetical protein